MLRSVTYIALAVLSTPLPYVSAQSPPPVELGERIRVTHDCPEPGAPPGVPWCKIHTGTVVVITADSLVLTLAAQGTRLSVPVASVTHIRVQRRLSRGTMVGRGAGIGAGILGSVALILGLANWGECEPGRLLEWQACGVGIDELLAAVGVFGGGGAVIGGFVGAVTKADIWEEVPLERLRVSFAPQRDGGFGLGLTVSF